MYQPKNLVTKKKIKFFKKYIKNFEDLNEINQNLKVAIITLIKTLYLTQRLLIQHT